MIKTFLIQNKKNPEQFWNIKENEWTNMTDATHFHDYNEAKKYLDLDKFIVVEKNDNIKLHGRVP